MPTPAAPETAWRGDVAKWYDALVGERGSDFQREIVFPGVLRLLDLKKGHTLLDVACGQGAFCREAQRIGAQVTGLDASEDLLSAARRQAGGVRYVAGDALRLAGAVPASAFDAVTCMLAMQNMDPLAPVLEGCARALRPEGHLVLVMTHPAFRIPRQSGWGWDEGRKLAYRRVDHYLSPLKVPIQTHPGANPSLVTWTFHRPLEAYVKAITAAGLLVDGIEEWASHKTSQPGARGKAENRAREEIPLFLAIRAVKPATAANKPPLGIPALASKPVAAPSVPRPPAGRPRASPTTSTRRGPARLRR